MKPHDLDWLNHDQEVECIACVVLHQGLNVLLLGLGLVGSATCVNASELSQIT